MNKNRDAFCEKFYHGEKGMNILKDIELMQEAMKRNECVGPYTCRLVASRVMWKRAIETNQVPFKQEDLDNTAGGGIIYKDEHNKYILQGRMV